MEVGESFASSFDAQDSGISLWVGTERHSDIKQLRK